MAQLVKLENGEAVRTYKLSRPQVVIGRSYDTDIEIANNTNVSRRHAQIALRNGRYVVEDLGSKNGTFVNGTRVESSVLTNQDVVQIGQVQFRFEETQQQAAKRNNIILTAEQESDKDVLPPDNTTVFFSPDRALEKLGDPSAQAIHQALSASSIHDLEIEKIEPRAKPKSGSDASINTDALKLRLLYNISKELITIKPLEEFLEVVVDLVFSVVDAERVFVMLMDEETNELVPSVVRVRNQAEDVPDSEIRVSRTITEKVTRERVAILTTDAQQDERFTGGQSIVVMGIRSAMCVPLQVGEKLLGIIYADTSMGNRIFDADDLALFSAFANHAAIGIEQARLNEKIRNEIAVRSVLERYHSPEVINTIMETGESIKPAERDITILYTDIKGFTTMVESMPPQELANLLNEYYSLMTDIIFQHGGTLDKFIGDAVMAIFGAPVGHEDDPQRAVRAAVAMQKALFCTAKDRPKEQRYLVRIGINTGKAITGDFGSEQRTEFTALGNTVNIAARIEHMVAKPGQIAVGEGTYLACKDEFPFTLLGNFTVKGISKPIKVYQVNYQKRAATTMT